MNKKLRGASIALLTAIISTTAWAQASELCSCTGRGGVNGVTLWGPKGEPCGGMKNGDSLPWGTYSNSCVKVEKIGKCAGEGGVKDLELWGPPGNVCGGLWENKDKYTVGQRSAKEVRLCSCKGKGGVEGVALWGPEGEYCAGIPEGWGKYDASCK